MLLWALGGPEHLGAILRVALLPQDCAGNNHEGEVKKKEKERKNEPPPEGKARRGRGE